MQSSASEQPPAASAAPASSPLTAWPGTLLLFLISHREAAEILSEDYHSQDEGEKCSVLNSSQNVFSDLMGPGMTLSEPFPSSHILILCVLENLFCDYYFNKCEWQSVNFMRAGFMHICVCTCVWCVWSYQCFNTLKLKNIYSMNV